MKLLQIVWGFPSTAMRPFGIYYFYWPLREAVLRGWEAEVLTFQVHDSQPAYEVIDGIKVYRYPAAKVRQGLPFKGNALSWPFLRALLTTDADIIHCHGYGHILSELTILIARLRRRRVIFTPHFTIYPYRRPKRELYDKTLGRFFFNLSDRVIVFTEYTYQHLHALGVRRERLAIVPHVSRPEVFADGIDEKEPGRLLREAGVTGSPLILGLGRISKLKGWEYTVRCLPSIVERFPEAKLLILGIRMPKEPSFGQHLMQLATDLGVSDHIQIMGHNPLEYANSLEFTNSPEFIKDAYRSATILTHPSVVESFCIVLIEALAAGLPVVAHNGTGLPCIIEDKVTGSIVDVRDTKAYTEALLALLSDPDMRQCMGAEGKRQAVTRFGQTEVASKLFAIYADSLSST